MIEALAIEETKPRPVAEILAEAPANAWKDVDPEQLLLIDTDQGTISVLLSDVLAQDHVAQMKTLAREGFYEGLSFYRVIEGFVAQGGDFAETKDIGSAAQALKAEFEEPLPNDAPFTVLPSVDGYAPEVGFIDGLPAGRDPATGTAWLAHCTGAFAYGRNVERDTASTEFYITLQPHRYLDRNLSVIGRVINGMTVVQAIPRGVVDDDPETDDFPEQLRLRGMRIAADVAEKDRPAFEIIDTDSPTFGELMAAYAARPSDFFYFRPNHMDLCQLPQFVRGAD